MGAVSGVLRVPSIEATIGAKTLHAAMGRKLLRGVSDEMRRTEYLRRLLYASHFRGSRSLYATLGGLLEAQHHSRPREAPILCASSQS